MSHISSCNNRLSVLMILIHSVVKIQRLPLREQLRPYYNGRNTHTHTHSLWNITGSYRKKLKHIFSVMAEKESKHIAD